MDIPSGPVWVQKLKGGAWIRVALDAHKFLFSVPGHNMEWHIPYTRI